jgi:hypothetical protein
MAILKTSTSPPLPPPPQGGGGGEYQLMLFRTQNIKRGTRERGKIRRKKKEGYGKVQVTRGKLTKRGINKARRLPKGQIFTWRRKGKNIILEERGVIVFRCIDPCSRGQQKNLLVWNGAKKEKVIFLMCLESACQDSC